jgi:catechol 2,3-dioxygenase-like lactoylglutathione lyase family enzyme
MTAPAPVAKPSLKVLPQRLHHYAFVIKHSEANRQFFEDILGLPLVATWCERSAYPLLGRKREVDYCHTFYGIGSH